MLGAGQYEEAIAQFDIVIRVLPKFAQAYNGRGMAYFHEDEFDLAFEDFDTAISLKPDLADAYMNRVAVHLTREQIPEAISDMRKALSLFEEQGKDERAKEVRVMLNIQEPK